MPHRVIMRIELSPAAKSLLDDLSERNGMTQVSVMSRMTEWFSRQDPNVQGEILGYFRTAAEADVAKLVLTKIIEGAA